MKDEDPKQSTNSPGLTLGNIKREIPIVNLYSFEHSKEKFGQAIEMLSTSVWLCGSH